MCFERITLDNGVESPGCYSRTSWFGLAFIEVEHKPFSTQFLGVMPSSHVENGKKVRSSGLVILDFDNLIAQKSLN